MIFYMSAIFIESMGVPSTLNATISGFALLLLKPQFLQSCLQSFLFLLLNELQVACCRLFTPAGNEAA